MVKEAIEDFQRGQQDKEISNKPIKKVFGYEVEVVQSWTLKPGDLIIIEQEQEFVADTLVIKFTNDLIVKFYIDTKNLDGETNLKEKTIVELFKDLNTE